MQKVKIIPNDFWAKKLVKAKGDIFELVEVKKYGIMVSDGKEKVWITKTDASWEILE